MRLQESSSPGYLDELRDGLPLSRAGACELLRCPDDDLPALLSAALELKQRFKPGIVTYSRKVFIPLTNLCRDYCGYCTFRRDPGEPGAHTMTPDQVMEVVHAGEKMGCTEALFSLGDKPELIFPEMRETLRHLGYKSTLHYLEAMCELVLRESTLLPHPNPGLLSAEWIARLAAVSPSMGLMLETTNTALLARGAAHDNAPDKVPAKRLRTIEEAGKQSVPFTTGLLIGIGESIEDRVDTLLAIRELHQRYGHIQEVIVQNFRVKPRDSDARLAGADAGRDAANRCGVAAAHAGDEYSGAAESFRSLLRRIARCRHQRLGRSFAADTGFHQSRKALAAS